MENELQGLSPLDIIKKANDKFEYEKEIDVKVDIDGEIELTTIKVKISENFSPTKITECIKEFVTNINTAKDLDKDGFGDIQEPYLMYLLIKYFTDLGEYIPSDFKEQLVSLKHMVNTTVLYQIMLNFNQEEIVKIKDEIESILETFAENVTAIEEVREEMKDKITNTFLLD